MLKDQDPEEMGEEDWEDFREDMKLDLDSLYKRGVQCRTLATNSVRLFQEAEKELGLECDEAGMDWLIQHIKQCQKACERLADFFDVFMDLTSSLAGRLKDLLGGRD